LEIMPTMIFPGNYESLEKIAEFVTAEARASGLNRTQVFAVETAVDEACSNIIEHAYGGEGIGDIHCTTISEPERFTMCLRITEEGLILPLFQTQIFQLP